ncbi:MAG TPA: FkbM family methyltransferase [Eudoraea sp.]|nr:FkbM family methyltransferase [Eudoraea sp.]
MAIIKAWACYLKLPSQMRKKTIEFIKDRLGPENLMVLDVGAKGGVQSLFMLDKFTNYVGFEPNLAEFSRLTEAPNIKYYPCVLSKVNGERKLLITDYPSYSSLLEFNDRTFDKHFHFMEDLPAWKKRFKVVGQVEIPSYTLSTFMDQNEFDFIDFIKLDTQGTELEILQSATDKLKDKRIGVIYSEVTFIEAYKNQNLFSDLEIFLREHDYEFIDCKYYPGSFDTFNPRLGSKIIEKPRYSLGGDAIFIPNIDAANLSNDVCFRIGLVLASLKYFSVSYHYLSNSGMAAEEIDHLLRSFNKPGIKNLLRQIFPPVLMHLMKSVFRTFKSNR